MKNQKQIKVVELNIGGSIIFCSIVNGRRMIPVRSICKIIDIDFKSQNAWLSEHPFFSKTYFLTRAIAADKKRRKMRCLNIIDIYGWLHSISLTGGRKPGSAEKQYALLAYLRQQEIKNHNNLFKSYIAELKLMKRKNAILNELVEKQKLIINLSDKIDGINDSIYDIMMNKRKGHNGLAQKFQQ